MDLQATLQPLLEKLQGWAEAGIATLPNLVVAAFVIGAFWFASRFARRLSGRLGERAGANAAIVSLMSTMAQYTVVVAGFLVALGVVGLQKTVVSILAGAGVAGLAVGFAFQDLAANFIAGIAMGVRQPFKIGDMVETGDYLGHVEAINLRNTILRLLNGKRVIVPNRMVFENPLVNLHTNGTRRVEFAVGVTYDTPLAEATEVARAAVEKLDFLADDTDVEIATTGFGGSSIDFIVRYWIDFPGKNYFAARHNGMLAVKKAFDAHEIGIPFPIRTLEFAGIDAGEHPFGIVAPEAEPTAA